MVVDLGIFSILLKTRHISCLGTTSPGMSYMSGRGKPCGSEMSKFWSKVERPRNKVALTRPSPRQVLLPVPKGMKKSGFDTVPQLDRNLKRQIIINGLPLKASSSWYAVQMGPKLGRKQENAQDSIWQGVQFSFFVCYCRYNLFLTFDVTNSKVYRR